MTEKKISILNKTDMEITWDCGHVGKFSDTECQTCLKLKNGDVTATAEDKKIEIQGLSNNEMNIQLIHKRLKDYSNVIKTSITKCEGEMALSVQDLRKKTTVVIKSSEKLLKDFKEGLDTICDNVLVQVNKMKKISLYKLCTNKDYRDGWYDYSKKALKLGFVYSLIRARNKIITALGLGGASVSAGTFAFAIYSWCT